MDYKLNMFTCLFTVLVCLQLSFTSIAQSQSKFGIKGGLNVSNLYVDNVTDENARIGSHFGVFAKFSSTSAVSLQTELLFTTKGSLVQYGGLVNQEVKYNLGYIEVPVLLAFNVGKFLELHAGGYGGYLLGANISYKGTLGNGVQEINKDNLHSYDYGLLAGLAVNVESLQIGVRYNYGLVKIADSSGANFLLGNSKNSCAQLFVAFSFQQ